MIVYNCQTCKKENRCSLQNDYARLAFFSLGRGVDIPDCQWHQPDYWHGLEGVMDTSRSEAIINHH